MQLGGGGDTSTGTAPSSDVSSASAGEQQTSPGLARRVAADPTALGAVDAPVVLIEYSDYRCPYCAVFARDTLPVLIEEYVDSGRVRFERRDVPVLGEESAYAALAARAAGEQGLYWEYHSALYAAAPTDGDAELSLDKLLAIADEVGVPDLDRFIRDIESDTIRESVLKDFEEAQRVGLDGTPSFMIGDTPVPGAQPIEVFRQIIDAELALAEKR